MGKLHGKKKIFLRAFIPIEYKLTIKPETDYIKKELCLLVVIFPGE